MSPAAVLDTASDAQPKRKHDPNAGTLSTLASIPEFEDKMKEREYVKERLAAGLRIFGKFGFDHHIVSILSMHSRWPVSHCVAQAGHLSVRDPVDPSTYWVNPIGKAFRRASPRCLFYITKTSPLHSDDNI